MRLPGLGPKTARRIWKELGITTVEGLRDAAEAHRLRDLDGLGAKSEEKILAALEQGPESAGAAAGAPRARPCRGFAPWPRRSRSTRRR